MQRLLHYGKKIKHHLHHHSKKVIHHVKEHHKKYLFGGAVSYIAAHLLIVKGFLLKAIFGKLFISLLVGLGIYENPMDAFAKSIVPFCIDGVSIVPGKECKDDLPLQQGIKRLEQKMNTSVGPLYTYKQHEALHEILKMHCDPKPIKDSMKRLTVLKSVLERKVLKGTDANTLIKEKGIYETIRKRNASVEDSDPDTYCSQKYLFHGIQEFLQEKHFALLQKYQLLGQDLLWNDISEEQSKILLPSLQQNIQETEDKLKEEGVIQKVNLQVLATHDLGTEYSQELKQKIMTLTQDTLTDLLQELKTQKVLDDEDLKMIDGKIDVSYMRGCTQTKGSYKLTRKVNKETHEVLSQKLDKITLNVNLCPSYEYIGSLDEYLKQIFIHEIGHHIYYYKDKHPEDFKKICWRDEKEPTCTEENFVSEYAQTSPEEDYAETFLHWYLGSEVADPLLQKKKNYFDFLSISP